jgi:hypothetical protein
MTAQQLRRLEGARRHPLLLVLLWALMIERATGCSTSSTSSCVSRAAAPRGASTSSA